MAEKQLEKAGASPGKVIDLVTSVSVPAGGTESATGVGGSSPGTSLHFCPWFCVKSQESGQGVNPNSNLPASRLYFKQNLIPSLKASIPDRPLQTALAACPWCRYLVFLTLLSNRLQELW